MKKEPLICVVGLGYVGLPLALAFSKTYQVLGFDLDSEKCKNIKTCHVSVDQCSPDKLRDALANGHFTVTDNLYDTRGANVYIVAVPTPVNDKLKADPTLLLNACRMVGKVLAKGDTVVFESTVWPGMTEEECVPILEEVSGLKLNDDFYVGYSPERINPADTKHPVEKITKIVSGSTPEAREFINSLYLSFLENGTYQAPSIRVAEASKIMENCQRDVLIAFTNEMFVTFRALGINVEDVIAAAKTKWNFVEMHPGLVGGHCIPVDPYYLIDRAAEKGIDTKLLKTARAINNSMATEYANRIYAEVEKNGGNDVLLLGFAFKPNCDDIRNTRVADIYRVLIDKGVDVTVCDPLINVERAKKLYGIDVIQHLPLGKTFDTIAVCTEHSIFGKSGFLTAPHKGEVLHFCK